jgi:hypothetical protein
MTMPPDAQIFFIIGRGRSGTTLLSKMLNSHAELAVAQEGLFILNLAGRYEGLRRWDDTVRGRFIEDLLREKRMAMWGIDRQVLAERLARAPEPPDYATLCLMVYDAYALSQDKRGIRVFGDKNPHYTLLLPRLERIFPDAKYIHLVRDYRDTIVSYRKVAFDLSNVAGLAERWNHYNRPAVELARRRPEACLCVRYEDLVNEPQREVARMCAFLGVAFDEGVLDYHKRDDPAAPAWFRTLFADLKAPLKRENAEKWRREMRPEEIALADAICGGLGRRFGYEPAAAPAAGERLPKLWGSLTGWGFSALERLLFSFPVRLRTEILNFERGVWEEIEARKG